MSIDSSVLADTLSDALRTDIVEQRDAPGAAVTESMVALRFGIARPTAKIIIERMVAEGLLRREPHHAARVPELGREDILDLFENRAIVESAALAALARGGTIPAPALHAHRALLEHVDSETPFAQHDIAFHRALVTGQPSPRLATMHGLLMGEIELCIGQVQAHQLLTARDVSHQHQGILDAVVAGDADLASQLTRDHITSTRQRLLAHYDATHA